MKAVILTLALAAAASAASANAQIPGRGIPTTTASRSTSVDGSWRVVGRDQSGTIYERSTYDRYGNIVVQRARRDANGNFRILSTRTVSTNGRNDCQVAGSNGSVSDIIFGRSGSGTYDCRSNGSTADGVWRRVGNNNGNSRIYVRRTYDRNGNVVIQRARRNPNGTFTILNSRTVRNNGNNRDDDRWENRNDRDDDDDRWDNRNDRDDDRWDNRQYNGEHNGKGKGKGKKGRD
jgi:hypothetical protein